MCKSSVDSSVCEPCQECLRDVNQDILPPALNRTTAERAAIFNTTCQAAVAEGSDQVDAAKCSAMTGLLMMQPDFGYRAGAVCQHLGICSAAAAAACTFNMQSPTGATLTGRLDSCTIEGVASGSMPPGFIRPLGECGRDLLLGSMPPGVALACTLPMMPCLLHMHVAVLWVLE
jgi:hypothetical protein